MMATIADLFAQFCADHHPALSSPKEWSLHDDLSDSEEIAAVD